MRIGYLVPEFPGQTHAFFWREQSALEALGNEVFLLSTRKPPREACRHAFAEEARGRTRYLFPPSPVRALRGLAASRWGLSRVTKYLSGLTESEPKQRARVAALLPSAAELLDFAREHDIKHVHGHSCADVAHLLALCRALGGPSYSLTLHGDLPVYGQDHRSKMRGAAFVSTVTRPLQEQVIERVGLPLDRVPVIWMGVDTQRFVARPERTEVPGELKLVTVARLNRMKGHVHALAALRRARDAGVDVRYTIAGDGPEREAIEREVRRLELLPWVELSGTIAEDEVLDLLQHADAFVLPSFGAGEAAPVSVMEAMSCELPVICSIIGGTADMITHGEDGWLVAQQDENGLTSAMISLARDVELRRRIGRAARRRAQAAFDYRANAKLLWETVQRRAG